VIHTNPKQFIRAGDFILNLQQVAYINLLHYPTQGTVQVFMNAGVDGGLDLVEISGIDAEGLYNFFTSAWWLSSHGYDAHDWLRGQPVPNGREARS
jgi:hypothetical protein